MNEKKEAIKLLEQRARGYSILEGLKSLRKRHILYISAVLGCLYLRTKHDNDVLFFILIGFFIGMIFRDTDWLRSFKHSWPFTEKVIDWNKVKEIAGKKKE